MRTVSPVNVWVQFSLILIKMLKNWHCLCYYWKQLNTGSKLEIGSQSIVISLFRIKIYIGSRIIPFLNSSLKRIAFESQDFEQYIYYYR